MRHGPWSSALLVPLVLAGCEANPTAPEPDVVTAELTLSTHHAHTLSPLAFAVRVTNQHGRAITDFDTLRVERLSEGATTWRTAAQLTLHDGVYSGEYTFTSSGAYELRLVGMRPGGAMETVATSEPLEELHVSRAHVNVGAVRIEFETFPGHIHSGRDTEMRFWVMGRDRNEAGERPPVVGLAGEIECHEPSGATERHTLEEIEAGVYSITHAFASDGEGRAEIAFTGGDGVGAGAVFHLHIAESH